MSEEINKISAHGDAENIQEEKVHYSKKQIIKIMLPLLIGGFIALLNETILNVAFPQLIESLNVPLKTIQWLGTAYMIVIGVLVPVTAFLIKTFTTRKLYLTAMILFSVGTILCGLSNSFEFLLISRVMQGVGTGMLLPIMMDTIMEIFPKSKRGTAMGISMMVVVAAPGIGPTLSGFILQYLDWHWLFFMMLPVAALAIVLGILFLKSYSTITKPKIDIFSIILSTIGFGGLIFGVSSIETGGVFQTIVLVPAIIGLLSLFLFAKRQFALEQPMLELRVFRSFMFTIGAFALFIAFMIPFAINIILPTYMQGILAVTTITAGLALLPGSIVNVIIAPVAGKLFDKIGAKPLAFSGFVALTVSMFFLSNIGEETPLYAIVLLQVLMTIGTGLVIPPTQTFALNQLPLKNMAHGVAILNTTQQVAAAFGSSIFIGLMGAVQEKHLKLVSNPDIATQHQALINGTNAAFSVAFILVIVGLCLSFFIKRRKSLVESL